MRPIELWSTIVAGLAGAALLALVAWLFLDDNDSIAIVALAGFAVGAGVQASVRLTGVS